MKKILFVCLGNICRSPMAEFVFKDLVKKEGLDNDFYIESAATSSEEIGNRMHYGTIQKLKEKNIEYGDKRARKLISSDYDKFDYIIGMDERNIINIERIVGKDSENKIYKLLDFSNRPRDIADPWYTGNFDKTYDDILEACKAFLKFILDKWKKMV